MSDASAWVLIGTVAAVGVLHTIVPDHWVPLTAIARQRAWTRAETARAAAQAGLGHVVSTLVIAVLVWIAGAAFARRFGDLADLASGVALIGFGGWIAIAGWRELRAFAPHGHARGHAHGHDRGHVQDRGQTHDHAPRDPLYVPLRGGLAAAAPHAHAHRHGSGPAHVHLHDHAAGATHPIGVDVGGRPPLHAHRHRADSRTALLLILGSSPMVEGIPAFFAAGRFGPALIAAMAATFAVSTIAAYVLLCTISAAGLERLRLGALERYGEVASGALVALVGAGFLLRGAAF